MNIYDIIDGFIPQEQKDDVKSKIDGLLEKELSKKELAVKKDLSTKYGVDFFQEDVNKAFDNKTFIKRELFEQTVQEKEELINQKEQRLKELESLTQEYSKDKEFFEAGLILIQEGLKPEKVGTIKPLLQGEAPLEEKVNKIKTELPELFGSGTQPITVVERNTQPKVKPENQLSGFENYINQQKNKK